MIGYIYKISCEDKAYYGLTTKNIYKRMSQHIKQYELYKLNKTTIKCASFEIFECFGLDIIKLELIEMLVNTTYEQLLAREIYYIQNNECINIRNNRPNKNINEVINKDIPIIDNYFVKSILDDLGYNDIDTVLSISQFNEET